MNKFALVLIILLIPFTTAAAEPTAQPQDRSANINERNLTEGGTWARQLLEDAKRDLPLLETDEDAAAFTRKFVVAFNHEIRLPSKGKIDMVYNAVPVSRRTVDDHRLVIKCGRELETIIKSVWKEYGRGQGIKILLDDLDSVLDRLENESPYAREERLRTIDEMQHEATNPTR